ncbi:MAG TPA: hypothetical protein PK668_15555 [Myxococcota bacterium]|nr:hypothetical protein [Myxococcota bacterium]HRY94311.1 hypothetical protein [Myxococcota bacterium]HSA24762.1 hypothetical protein [Myxococcota bacterium]
MKPRLATGGKRENPWPRPGRPCDTPAPEEAPISALLASFGLLVGLSTALAAWAQITHAARPGAQAPRPVWRSPHLAGALLYEVLAVSPLAIYFYFRHPGWSLLYLLEPGSPWLVVALLALAPPALAALGFLAGAALIQAGLLLPARAAVALVTLALASLAVWLGPRLLHVAEGTTWAEAPGPSGELAAILAFALPVLLAGWIFLLALSWVEGRKLLRMLAFQREARGGDSSAPRLSGPPAPAQNAGGGQPGF